MQLTRSFEDEDIKIEEDSTDSDSDPDFEPDWEESKKFYPKRTVKAKRKLRKKPKLIFDKVKTISDEELKSQIADTSDIVVGFDIAPPTKRLMYFKETGGVERVFSVPGHLIFSKGLSKVYKKHLTTSPAENEDFKIVEESSDLDTDCKPSRDEMENFAYSSPCLMNWSEHLIVPKVECTDISQDSNNNQTGSYEIPDVKPDLKSLEKNFYACNMCQQTFPNISDHVNHLKTHISLPETPYVCYFCHMTFSEINSYEKHIDIHAQQYPKSELPEKRFTCDVCKRSFPRKGKLEMHLKKEEECPKMHTEFELRLDKIMSKRTCGRGELKVLDDPLQKKKKPLVLSLKENSGTGAFLAYNSVKPPQPADVEKIDPH